MKTKHASKNQRAGEKKELDLAAFYERFAVGVRDIKLSLRGELNLKDAKTWLDELKDN